MICIARTFGAPETVPAGKHARSRSKCETSALQLPGDLGDEVRDVREPLRLEEALDLHRAGPADAREVVPAEVDEHHVLGAVLLRGRAAAPRRRRRARVVPAIGFSEARRPSRLDERLRRGADECEAVELEQEEVRRRVDAPQRAVELERARRGRPLGALREDDLERVAGADVLLRLHDRALVLVPRREPARRARPRARRAAPARAAAPRAARRPRRARRTAPRPCRARGRSGRACRRRRSGSRAGRARRRAAAPSARAARRGRSRGSRRPARPHDSASSKSTRREPQPTNEWRPSRPCSTDSSRKLAAPALAQPEVRPERGEEVG